jgi:hypothetical protein
MTPAEREWLEGKIRNCTTDAQLEAEMQKWTAGSEHRRMVRDALVKRRAEASPSYEQKERHHRDVTRAARNAAVISIIGALASWAGVLVKCHRSEPIAAPASPPAAMSPPATPQESAPPPESPAVISPAPTLEEEEPTLEEEGPAPEESVPTPTPLEP